MSSYRKWLSLIGIAALSTHAPAWSAPAATIGIAPNCCQYAPTVANIQAGDSVAFAASNFHPLRFTGDVNDDNACDVNCTKIFTQPGNYPFFCLNHQGSGMSGLIMVSANPDMIFIDGFEYPIQPDS